MSELLLKKIDQDLSTNQIEEFMKCYSIIWCKSCSNVCLSTEDESPGLYGFLNVIIHSASGLRQSLSKLPCLLRVGSLLKSVLFFHPYWNPDAHLCLLSLLFGSLLGSCTWLLIHLVISPPFKLRPVDIVAWVIVSSEAGWYWLPRFVNQMLCNMCDLFLDLYCTMEVDSFGLFVNKAKTRVYRYTTEPKWNEVRLCPVHIQ